VDGQTQTLERFLNSSSACPVFVVQLKNKEKDQSLKHVALTAAIIGLYSGQVGCFENCILRTRNGSRILPNELGWHVDRMYGFRSSFSSLRGVRVDSGQSIATDIRNASNPNVIWRHAIQTGQIMFIHEKPNVQHRRFIDTAQCNTQVWDQGNRQICRIVVHLSNACEREGVW
jgi:hypothetical protein